MPRRITQSVALLAAVALVCLGSSARADLLLGLDSHNIDQADGTAISAWTSGFGDATQTVPIRQPTYLASSAALGGHPAVALDNVLAAIDGVNGDGMSTSVTGLSNTYTIMTLYAAHFTDDGTSRVVQGGNGVFNAQVGAAANNWLLGPYAGTHRMYDGDWILTNDSVKTPVILTALGSPAIANELYFNGGLAGTNANNNAPNFVGIGTEGAWAEPADSDLGAVLVFDTRLTNDERVGVEHFLAAAFDLDGFDATPAQQAAAVEVLDGFLVIPEPGSISLFVLGISGLIAVGFRRRRRAGK